MMPGTRRPLWTMLVATTLAFAALSAAGFVLARPARGAALAAAPAAADGDTLRLSLDEALDWAIRHGPEVRIADLAVRAANGRVQEAMAPAFPQVNGTLTYGRKFDSIFRSAEADTGFAGMLSDLFANTPFASVHSWTAEITASQLLWSGGRVGAGLAAARAYRKSMRADHAETVSQVTVDVKRAYLEAVYASHVLAIAESSLAQARAQLRQVELYQREGTRAEYDLLRARVDAANQEPPVVAARNAVVLAQLELKRQLHLPLGRPLALVTPLEFPEEGVPVPDEATLDAAGRAALARADAEVEGRRQLLRIERAARWPQLSVSGTLSQQAFPANGRPRLDDFGRNVDASVKLDFPIFLGTRTFGAVTRATAELRQAEIQRERTRDAVAVDLERSRQEVRRALSVLVARRGTAQLAERTYRLARVRYTNGLSTQLEVTDARLQLQTAQVNEVAAVKDYRIALVELERAVGHTVKTTRRSLDQISLSEKESGL